MPILVDISDVSDGMVIVPGAGSYAQIGVSVGSAGDVNGDGIDDYLFTGPVTDEVNEGRGVTYVLFGRTGGIGAIDLGALTSGQGFAIYGPDTWSGSGGVDMVAAGAGDVNGDGYDDVVIGAPRNSQAGQWDGRAFVYYGHGGSFGAVDVTADGSIIHALPSIGANSGAFLGVSVAGAGDVNGDGYADILIGAENESTGGAYAGRAYLLFGSAAGFGDMFNLATMTPEQGIALHGTQGGAFAANDVAGIGDINGDGFDDFAIGAPNQNGSAGNIYVYFGRASGLASGPLTTIPAGNGFIVRGAGNSGRTISVAGDVNGDGFDDFIIGSGDIFGQSGGGAFLIFGHAGGFGTLQLDALTAEQGYRITRGAAPVSGGGDINGDGFDDVVIGSFILFGAPSFPPQSGEDVPHVDSGSQLAVGIAGDINNDGLADLVTGYWRSDGWGYATGVTYLHYAGAPTEAVNRTGNAASQTLAGGAGDDTLRGLGGDDRLFGNVGQDLLEGGDGRDWLRGGDGADTLRGGAGDDVYLVDAADTIVELAGQGVDTVETGLASYALGANLESLVGTASGGQTLTGNAAVNRILGGAGNDVLEGLGSGDVLEGGDGADRLVGGAGADRMAGGAGDDLYVIGASDGADTIVEQADAGTDTVRTAQAAHVLAAHVELLVYTGTGAFTGTGNDGANRIDATAGSGGHVLNGNGGNDVLLAGAGNDRLDGGAGEDTLEGGGGDDTLRGGTDADLLDGGTGDDRIDGGAGADGMTGGVGNDRYVVDDAGDAVVELAGGGNDRVDATISYTLAANIEMLVLTGTSAIDGTGNGLANTLIGNSNANRLDGGAGADLLEGGKGDDVYVVDNAGDKVIEADGGGSDIVHSSVSFSLAGQFVEVVNLTGAAAINATGNGLANRLVGNGANNVLYGMDGNDRLDGGAGNDTMRGGLGNDVFVVDSAGDTVQENNGEGLDTVEAWISYSLAGQYIESLKLMGAAHINATGNGQANELIGNAGNNVLNGQQGADILRGGAGDDRLIVDHAGDKVFENANEGNDIVQSSVSFSIAGQHIEALVLTGTADIDGEGNSFANVITGNGGANLLIGGGGNDALHGGLGSDRLHGGAGQDGFWFDVDLNANNIDTIADFTAADDTIWLDRTIFTTVDEGALAAGAFATGTAAADADDRIVYDAATGNIWYDPDGVGGLAAGLFAVVTAGTALTAGDFVAVP